MNRYLSVFLTHAIVVAVLILLPASTSAQSASSIVSNMITAQEKRIVNVQDFTLYGQFEGRSFVQNCVKSIRDSMTSFRCSEVLPPGQSASPFAIAALTTGLLAGLLSSDMSDLQTRTTAMTVVGTETVGAVRAYHLKLDPAKLTGPEASMIGSMDLWIDSSQMIISKIESATKADPGSGMPSGTSSALLEGWRELGGMLFPTKITVATKADANPMLQTMRTMIEQMPADQQVAMRAALEGMERMQSGAPMVSTVDSARVNRGPPRS